MVHVCTLMLTRCANIAGDQNWVPNNRIWRGRAWNDTKSVFKMCHTNSQHTVIMSFCRMENQCRILILMVCTARAPEHSFLSVHTVCMIVYVRGQSQNTSVKSISIISSLQDTLLAGSPYSLSHSLHASEKYKCKHSYYWRVFFHLLFFSYKWS